MNRLNGHWAVLLAFTGILVFTVSLTSGVGSRISLAEPSVEGARSTRSLAQDPSVVTRRLYEGPKLEPGDISPDGRYLTQTDWDTGDLAVFDLLTGQLRRVTDKGSWEDSDAMAEMAVFSPNGEQIAYTWMNEEGWYEVRLIGVDGSDSRVLLEPDPERWTWPGLLDWSPDGRHLLLDLANKWDSEELALASVRDGTLQVLFDELPERRGAMSAAFSPDGRYVAFEQPSRPISRENTIPDGDIGLISVLGGGAVPLLTGPANDRLIGWEPDGRSILFASDRDLTEGVWRIQVVDGKAIGEPELVKADLWHFESIGVAEGRVYYGLVTEGPQLYTVGIDLEQARILTPPTPVEESPDWEPVGWAWAPDGRRLAYTRTRSSWVNELVIRSLPGDPERVMPLPIRGVRTLSWAPDGRSLVLESLGGSWEDPAWTGLYRVDLETGACTPMETGRHIISSATLSRNLESAFYDGGGWRSPDPEGHDDALWARSLETGEEREVTRLPARAPYRGYPALSPDERWVARFNLPADDPDVRAVEIVSTESGEVREIYRSAFSLENPEQCGTLSWSPDGKYLVYGVANPVSGGCTLQRLSVDGGNPTPMGDLPSFTSYGGLMDPLGSRLAFKHGEFRGEIWVLEYGTPDQRSRADSASRIGR